MDVGDDLAFYFECWGELSTVDGELFVEDHPFLDRMYAALSALVELVDAALYEICDYWAVLSF